MILTSQAASRVAKDRAMLLKEEIIAKLHGKGNLWLENFMR